MGADGVALLLEEVGECVPETGLCEGCADPAVDRRAQEPLGLGPLAEIVADAGLDEEAFDAQVDVAGLRIQFGENCQRLTVTPERPLAVCDDGQ